MPSTAEGNGSSGWTSSFSGWFSVGLGLWESLPDFAKICLFLLDWPNFEEILADLNEIRRNLEEISARSGPISKRSGEISVDLEEIKRDLEATKAKNLESNQNTFNKIGDDSQSCWFFPPFAKGSWPLSDKLDKIDRQTTSIDGESYFWWVFRSGRLKIGFPSSNLSTDPLISGFGSGDPSLTVVGVKSAGSWAGLVRLGGWVGWRV